MIRVFILDDHKMFVQGLERIINESDIARITGVAFSIEECRSLLKSDETDVLLLDIKLPDGNGVDFCAEIRDRFPAIKILVLTSYSERNLINSMLNHGVDGYVLKNSLADEILIGIKTVIDGEKFFCEEVDLLLQNQPAQNMVLTRKEREILTLICEGYINSEIAKKMFLSVETINSYRKNLLLKFNVRNTAMLVKMAVEQKMI